MSKSTRYDQIKDLILFAKGQGLSKLKIEGKKTVIQIEFPYASTAYAPVAPISSVIASAAPVTPISTAPIPAAVVHNYHEVKSPFVGTFYLSSAPGKPPYCQVGSKVKKGQTLCIIEAMKIMNQIEADADGEVVEICCDNENLVEYNQTLFKLQPTN